MISEISGDKRKDLRVKSKEMISEINGVKGKDFQGYE